MGLKINHMKIRTKSSYRKFSHADAVCIGSAKCGVKSCPHFIKHYHTNGCRRKQLCIADGTEVCCQIPHNVKYVKRRAHV